MTDTTRVNVSATLPDYEQRLTSIEAEVADMKRQVDAMLAEVRSWPRTDGGLQ